MVPQLKRHIPNALTGLRLILAFAFPLVPESWRLPIFVVAAFTEFADGFLARKLDVVTKWGKIADPIADKAFVLAVIVTFFLEQYVELWEIVVVGIRDMIVFFGAAWVWFFGERSDFDSASARVLGKLTTNFQFLFLLSILLLKDAHIALVVTTGVFSAAAGVDYFLYYQRQVRN